MAREHYTVTQNIEYAMTYHNVYEIIVLIKQRDESAITHFGPFLLWPNIPWICLQYKCYIIVYHFSNGTENFKPTTDLNQSAENKNTTNQKTNKYLITSQ